MLDVSVGRAFPGEAGQVRYIRGVGVAHSGTGGGEFRQLHQLGFLAGEIGVDSVGVSVSATVPATVPAAGSAAGSTTVHTATAATAHAGLAFANGWGKELVGVGAGRGAGTACGVLQVADGNGRVVRRTVRVKMVVRLWLWLRLRLRRLLVLLVLVLLKIVSAATLERSRSRRRRLQGMQLLCVLQMRWWWQQGLGRVDGIKDAMDARTSRVKPVGETRQHVAAVVHGANVSVHCEVVVRPAGERRQTTDGRRRRRGRKEDNKLSH